MGGGKKEREMRSPEETAGRGDDEMRAAEREADLKEVERRRLGGKLPPGSEQPLHSVSCMGSSVTAAQLCLQMLSHSQQAPTVWTRDPRTAKQTSRLSQGRQSGNNFLELSLL